MIRGSRLLVIFPGIISGFPACNSSADKGSRPRVSLSHTHSGATSVIYGGRLEATASVYGGVAFFCPFR